jgi:hypothetical protein
LCFKCPNEQCEPILDIYVPRAFQWYKKRHKKLSFNPLNCSLKFQESTGTPSLKVGVALGVWGFTPSHFLTLPGVCDVTPGLPLGPHSCNPFALVASLKPGLRQCIMHLAIVLWANLFVSGFESSALIMRSTSSIVCGLQSSKKKMKMCACGSPRFWNSMT